MRLDPQGPTFEKLNKTGWNIHLESTQGIVKEGAVAAIMVAWMIHRSVLPETHIRRLRAPRSITR